MEDTLIPSTKLDVRRLEPVSAEKAAAINIEPGKDFVHLGGEHGGGESSKLHGGSESVPNYNLQENASGTSLPVLPGRTLPGRHGTLH